MKCADVNIGLCFGCEMGYMDCAFEKFYNMFNKEYHIKGAIVLLERVDNKIRVEHIRKAVELTHLDKLEELDKLILLM
jgi:hypothetical protein